MIEGKDRVRLEWTDGYGQQRTQVIPNTTRIDVAEGVLLVYVKDGDQQFVVSIIPVHRLVRAAALKNEEVEDVECGEAGESAEDPQVSDASDE